MEIIVYTSYFLKTAGDKQPQFEKVKDDYSRLFKKAESCLNEGKFSAQEWDMARFAICAWIDESILCSDWEGKSSWKHEQLQRVFYRTTNAGEDFFNRLNELDPEDKAVREVYAYCLALGFKGRYFRKEDEVELENIKESNFKYLLDRSSPDISIQDTEELFPGAYSTFAGDTKSHKFRSPFSLFTIIFLVWPPVLFGILLFLYHDLLQKIFYSYFG